MNSSKGKQPTQRPKQPTRRTAKQQNTTKQAPARRAASSRPSVAKGAAASRPSAAAKQKGAAARRSKASSRPRSADAWSRIASSRVAIVAIVVVCALAVVGVFDTASNWGKAYGNVTVNGVNVGGMTADEMTDALKSEFGARVSHAQVTIYADEAAREQAAQDAQADALQDSETADEGQDDGDAPAEGDFGPDSRSWQVDALSLKATVPYETAVSQALDVGRGDGGLLKRLGLVFGGEDVPLAVAFDDGLLEELASSIDQAIGDPRVDATVSIEDGVATPVEGQSGKLVDRGWLEDMISRAMISGDVPDSFVAKATEAQSRITDDQASAMADAVNRAIAEGAVLSYQGRTWLAGPAVLGEWTQVSVDEADGAWQLVATIDSSQAIPLIVEKVGAEMTSDDVVVSFENADDVILVHTSGSGNIPEVSTAVENLQAALYGDGGAAWGEQPGEPVAVEVTESDRPEMLTFDDAVNLGVITVIGECTTEFTDVEGTENRNHNIKLAADMLDGSIVEANGGTWSFNDRAGDTNEEAGFWTAGSIIDGEIVDSVGGGICQVATTVFNSVLEGGLEVNERHNHTMYMANYPVGRDAAIDYPTYVDLVWTNGLQSDVLLDMSYTDTSVTARLYSVYTGYSSEYEIGDWEEGEKYKTVFEEDDTLADGYYYLKTAGEDGSKIMVTRYVSDSKGDSVLIDAFESNYEAQDEVYVVGPNTDTSGLGSAGGSQADDPQGASPEPGEGESA